MLVGADRRLVRLASAHGPVSKPALHQARTAFREDCCAGSIMTGLRISCSNAFRWRLVAHTSSSASPDVRTRSTTSSSRSCTSSAEITCAWLRSRQHTAWRPRRARQVVEAVVLERSPAWWRRELAQASCKEAATPEESAQSVGSLDGMRDNPEDLNRQDAKDAKIKNS